MWCTENGNMPVAPAPAVVAAAATPTPSATLPATPSPAMNPWTFIFIFLHFDSPDACVSGPLTLLAAVAGRSPFSVEKPAASTAAIAVEGTGIGPASAALRTLDTNDDRASKVSPRAVPASAASIVPSSTGRCSGISEGLPSKWLTGLRPLVQTACEPSRSRAAGAVSPHPGSCRVLLRPARC